MGVRLGFLWWILAFNLGQRSLERGETRKKSEEPFFVTLTMKKSIFINISEVEFYRYIRVQGYFYEYFGNWILQTYQKILIKILTKILME